MSLKNKSKGEMGAASGLDAGAAEFLGHRIEHTYHVECHGADGKLKWSDTFHNLVTTAGLNKYLDATLKTGLAAPAWYVGLIVGPGAGNTYLAADTSAVHAGWTEFIVYSNPTRPAWTPGAIAAGSVDNSASRAVFNINGVGGTVAGCFMIDNSTIGGGTGTLLGEGNFATGDRVLISGDTLSVTVTATQT